MDHFGVTNSSVSRAAVVGGGSDRQKRDIPNWSLTSSDFFGWVDELHRYGGYEHIEQLTRTFWAHFPSAERLGYMQRSLDSNE
ncbi:otospiralin-like [Synchiropus splendidus]|uniref:otospiralin-like n=1 Tax=Synchiropus splendidus TaxID=270530 RepID=UPI00237D98E1|nr:otospiralin-like [Synchiropus splendidus]